MEESKEFFILRYNLIKENHANLDIRDMPERKGLCVSEVLKDDREFESGKAKYSFVGFSEVLPKSESDFSSDRFWTGKIAKLRKVNLGEKIPRDIVGTEKDDWIALDVILDTQLQYILVSKDFQFGKPEQIIRAFQKGISKQISELYNYEIFVQGVIEKNAFWSVVENYKCFYNLQLKLVSPNILETNKKARLALEELQSAFCHEEVDIRLKNANGKLTFPKETASDYVEYIENGEGSWKLTTEDKDKDGGTKNHSSLDYIKTISLSISEEQDNSNNIFNSENKASKLEYNKTTDIRTKIIYEAFAYLNKLQTWL